MERSMAEKLSNGYNMHVVAKFTDEQYTTINQSTADILTRGSWSTAYK